MKKNLPALLIAFLLLYFAEIGFATLPFGPAKLKTAGGAKWVPNEIIVKFKDGLSKDRINRINQRHTTSVLYTSPFAGFKRIKVPAGKTARQVVELYNSEPDVEYAQLNYYAYALFVPNDPLYSFQWHFNDPCVGINIEPAWNITTGDPNVIVAVVDTGVAYEDYNAPDHWHIDSYKAYDGNSWWCGLNNPHWATPPGYGNGWKDYLQHPFDLNEAVGTVTFSYYYEYDIEQGYDYFYVDVSDNGGATWTNLKEYTNKPGPPGGRPVKWTSDSVNLTGYKGKNILIRFRFNSDEIYSDEDGYFNSDGAVYIDEIKLEDNSGVLFYDNVESGPGLWETTKYQQAPDLADTLFVDGNDFINGDEHSNDDYGHGTHVAGTIAQSTNNALGIAGIAFNCAIMPVKVLDSTGTGTAASLTDGILYAANNGAKVINMSLGFPPDVTPADLPTVTAAVQYAYTQKGCILVASSGNDGVGTVSLPAAYPQVIAVGAINSAGNRAGYSQYGPQLELVAPGGDGADRDGDGYIDGVLQQTFSSTPKDWGYWFYTGTSMAAPHVSGIAALLISTGVTDPDAIREALQSTARDLGTPGWDVEYGWGLVDAYAALTYYSIPGDFTGNGFVDFEDLEILVSYWLQNEPSVDIAPPGRDGIINFLDFAGLAENWN